jgi:hypothetical protein
VSHTSLFLKLSRKNVLVASNRDGGGPETETEAGAAELTSRIYMVHRIIQVGNSAGRVGTSRGLRLSRGLMSGGDF